MVLQGSHRVGRSRLATIGLGLCAALAALAGAATAFGQEPIDGATAVRSYCSGCHRETSPGHFDRISNIRKTPEGWVMTLFRMKQVHGLALEAPTRDAIVRYLSEVNGLAPSEAASSRFALERRPNVPDLEAAEDLKVMCGRCHTMARVALQRRDSDEWLKLVNTHVGQWPSLEFHASSRDRLWWQTATTEVPGKLASLYPFDTPAWREWRERPPAALEGKWLVHGHTPGRGDYSGIATVTKRGANEYSASYALTHADGTRVEGSSKSNVYTGYEWRGTAKLGSEAVREVFAVSEDGSQMKGRWFLQDHSEEGGDWTAMRAAGPPRIVSVAPRALKVGATQTVVVVGSGLEGVVSFGPRTRAKIVERDENSVTVSVTTDAGAAPGYRTIQVGKLKAAELIAVYDRVDRVEVVPGYAIARVGGGKTAPVSAQFEAIGYANVSAGSGKTQEVRLGALPANWSVEPFNPQAQRDKDVQFAGAIDQAGRFVPGAAGPNPQRQYSGNNVGNLSVVAKIQDGGAQGKSHLIVTVQRWNTPPIY